MTPIWVTLLVAGVGLAGVLWTQHTADKRATADRKAAEGREAVSWRRAQARDAHAAFLAEQWKAEHHLTMWNQVGNVDEPSPDWTEPMARQLQVVRIFGSKKAHVAGSTLLRITTEMASPAWGVGRYLELDGAKDRYVATVRRDLGVDDTPPLSAEDTAAR